MNPGDFYNDLQMLSIESEINAVRNKVQSDKIQNATKAQKQSKR